MFATHEVKIIVFLYAFYKINMFIELFYVSKFFYCDLEFSFKAIKLVNRIDD